MGINKEKITFLEKDTKHKSQKIIDANNNFETGSLLGNCTSFFSILIID